MNRLQGKFAVVTGGAKGIGEKIVKNVFLSEGCEGVAILDYDAATANETVKRLRSRVRAVRATSGMRERSKERSERSIRIRQDRYSGQQCGAYRDAMVHKMTYEQWYTVLGVI
jgi:NAD(P)-dependent dehydrogenase (short-subunit alcohol dehydrogenase family)